MKRLEEHRYFSMEITTMQIQEEKNLGVLNQAIIRVEQKIAAQFSFM